MKMKKIILGGLLAVNLLSAQSSRAMDAAIAVGAHLVNTVLTTGVVTWFSGQKEEHARPDTLIERVAWAQARQAGREYVPGLATAQSEAEQARVAQERAEAQMRHMRAEREQGNARRERGEEHRHTGFAAQDCDCPAAREARLRAKFERMKAERMERARFHQAGIVISTYKEIVSNDLGVCRRLQDAGQLTGEDRRIELLDRLLKTIGHMERGEKAGQAPSREWLAEHRTEAMYTAYCMGESLYYYVARDLFGEDLFSGRFSLKDFTARKQVALYFNVVGSLFVPRIKAAVDEAEENYAEFAVRGGSSPEAEKSCTAQAKKLIARYYNPLLGRRLASYVGAGGSGSVE